MKGEIQNKLDQVITNQKSLLQRMDAIESQHTEVEKSITFNAQSIEELKVENTGLTTKATKMAMDLNEARAKINQLQDNLLRMERYSRGYNLRFGGIPELPHESPAYPYEQIKQILSDRCGLVPEIENAHRSGRSSNSTDGKPRHILVKFLYRPERQAVLVKAKSSLSSSGIYVMEDLPAADLVKKRSLKDVMLKAYQAGKKPVFRNGNLYISGQLYTPPSQTSHLGHSRQG